VIYISGAHTLLKSAKSHANFLERFTCGVPQLFHDALKYINKLDRSK